MFHMSNDSSLFYTMPDLERKGHQLNGNIFTGADGETYLPLYEAKMIHQYTHKFATYDEPQRSRLVNEAEMLDPNFHVMPRYWLQQSLVKERLKPKIEGDNLIQDWLLTFRDIARSTDERTAIFSRIPFTATNNKLPLIFFSDAVNQNVDLFYALVNSFVFDYLARQFVGGTNLSYFILKQLALPTLEQVSTQFMQRISELVSELDSWQVVNPKPSNIGKAERNTDYLMAGTKSRQRVRCEIDAYCFEIFGMNLGEAEYILDQFPVLRHRETAEFGFYKTKEMILNYLERLAI